MVEPELVAVDQVDPREASLVPSPQRACAGSRHDGADRDRHRSSLAFTHTWHPHAQHLLWHRHDLRAGSNRVPHPEAFLKAHTRGFLSACRKDIVRHKYWATKLFGYAQVPWCKPSTRAS